MARSILLFALLLAAAPALPLPLHGQASRSVSLVPHTGLGFHPTHWVRGGWDVGSTATGLQLEVSPGRRVRTALDVAWNEYAIVCFGLGPCQGEGWTGLFELSLLLRDPDVAVWLPYAGGGGGILWHDRENRSWAANLHAGVDRAFLPWLAWRTEMRLDMSGAVGAEFMLVGGLRLSMP